MNRLIFIFSIGIFSLVFLSGPTDASNIRKNFNDKNGNFFVAYTDYCPFEIEKGFCIDRTYNSKSLWNQTFGMGWGSNLDTYLLISPSGKPIIFNIGSGARFYMEPVKERTNYISNYDRSMRRVEAILNRTAKKQGLKTSKDINIWVEEKLNLIKSEDLNGLLYWNRLLQKNSFPFLEISEGTRFKTFCNCDFVFHELTKTKDGFVLSEGDNDDITVFDKDGFVSSIEKKSGVKIIIYRTKNRKGKSIIAKIQSGEDVLDVETNDDGYITKIYSPQTGRQALYQYKGRDLIFAKNINGNEYRYKYDSQSNLIKISYTDGTTRKMHYTRPGSFVDEILYEDGTVVQMEYGDSNKNESRGYYTEVRYITPPDEGAIESYEKREYFFEGNSDRISRKVFTIDAIRREMFVDEDGVIRKIIESSPQFQNSVETSILYNRAGNVIRKKSSNWSQNIEYRDGKSDLITSIENIYGNESVTYYFKYDGENRLKEAKSSGRMVKFFYINDESKKIERIEVEDKKILFKRNSFQELVTLELQKETSKPDQSFEKIIDEKYLSQLELAGVLAGVINMCEYASASIAFN